MSALKGQAHRGHVVMLEKRTKRGTKESVSHKAISRVYQSRAAAEEFTQLAKRFYPNAVLMIREV